MNHRAIAVIGAGSWGTALALYLVRLGHPVRLWARRPDLAEQIRANRENREYLPGFALPEALEVDSSLESVLQGAGSILSVIPSHTVRDIFREIRPVLPPEMKIVTATKGIETGTCRLMSEVICEALGSEVAPQVAVLSGPSFALEVARGDPTAVVVAAPSLELARFFQETFAGGNLRVYTSSDPVGTQIGGAVKNIVAIAAGLIHGLGFGTNTVAALITRGLAELIRLCVAAGGQVETLSGLAGLGDLVLTSTGALSRNRRLGVELGRGRKLEEILHETRSVTEGFKTTASTHEWARRLKVEMPITAQVYSVLYEGKPPLEAVRNLMERELKSEF